MLLQKSPCFAVRCTDDKTDVVLDVQKLDVISLPGVCVGGVSLP